MPPLFSRAPKYIQELERTWNNPRAAPVEINACTSHGDAKKLGKKCAADQRPHR
jgi:hypothetical protein